ncbi:MAG: isoprenylcysteine carboxylmethyltransferase family protein [Chloroflexi bacterium]|nr:isoprenylcysteine carboxylmethyltransferase family protein [Chloroflexota bacterium]
MERAITTTIPLVFLANLFISEALFKQRGINIDGHPPIDKKPFYTAKYSVILIWAGMSLQSWRIGFQVSASPSFLQQTSLCLWVVGFTILFLGKVNLGRDFRLGSANETTSLRIDGLYRFSRNPMYVGLYSTIVASILYTRNPVLLALGLFIIIVHHKIVLAEEGWLLDTFGQDYERYRRKVKRYI